jgi:hypothetical protein
VNGCTIAKALVDENALAKKIDELSAGNPVKSRRLRIAERVDKIADPMLMIPIFAASGICAAISVPAGIVLVAVGGIGLLSASIWATLVQARVGPGVDDFEGAKRQLSDAKDAKAELCAKAGISERMVETLQALPLEAGQKQTVLRQAIFHDPPEDYVRRVAGILGGIAARGEDLKEYAESRLDTLSRDISQALELAGQAEGMASSGDEAQAAALFAGSAKALERALDYAGAAEMYKKASDNSMGNKARAAELSAKSGDCYLKAGDNAGAKERFEWAAMIVGETDPGLSAELQGKAIALI